jgi:hypothetical protein
MNHMNQSPKFAKIVYTVAGVYGLLVLLPQYFLEERTGRDYPPAITHPEFYYGFVGIALAWQVLFLILAGDPVRYRAMMIPTVLEKFTFGIAALILFLTNRMGPVMLGAAIIDLILGTLFIAAYLKTGERPD